MIDKRNLYFINSRGEYRIIMANVEKHEALLAMDVFLKNRNYKRYYTRSWDTDEGTMYDVGSWSEFFLWGNHNDKD